jgi:hypothetical protein
MAQALHFPAVDPTLQAHPKLTFEHGQYRYAIERRGDQSIYTVTDGKDTVSLPIRWAFGAHSQTYVLEHEGKYYEGLVSYYEGINGLDITIGDQAIHPGTVFEAMGRPLATSEVQQCVGCHTTGAIVDRQLNLESLRPGVTCDHCHSGADNHLQAISHAKLDSVPPKLGRLSAEDISNFCGQCHRTWERVVQGKLFGQVNVRFQPYRLANSKCFDGSDKRISCIACHNPHEEVVRDGSFYDGKCLACHSSAAKPSLGMVAMHLTTQSNTPSNIGSTAMKTCPVAKANCVSCHMPKVTLPGGHMIFTDHDIRVVRQNEPYPN